MSDTPASQRDPQRDPVCGQPVDPLRARAVGIWGARTYYFCSPEHKAEFGRNPAAYLGASPRTSTPVTPAAAPTPTPARRRLLTPSAPVAASTPSPTPTPTSPSATVPDGRPANATPVPMRILDEGSGPIAPPRSRTGLYVLLTVAALVVALLALLARR